MTMRLRPPELLAPAGNLEKLMIAFRFGADAVYCGGTMFGLRQYADNFTQDQLQEGTLIAKNLGKKIYVVLNGFPHNEDMKKLSDYLTFLEDLQPHGLIISDLGIITHVKQQTTIPIHISTQASVTNWRTCQFFKEAGAHRIILAREVSIDDCRSIASSCDQHDCDIELEVFVHGAQCASYSGKCVISNYTSGRDSNRGGCLQSCRHKYDIIDPTSKEIEASAFIMNAKDQMAIHLIPSLIESGIQSLKIEGRMKSNMYLANTVSNYRSAIDQYIQKQEISSPPLAYLESQLSKVSNRSFESGGLESRPLSHTIQYNFSHSQKHVEFIGTIKEILPHRFMICEVRFPFRFKDMLEIHHQTGDVQSFDVSSLSSLSGESIKQAQSSSLVKLPWIKNTKKYDIIRMPVHQEHVVLNDNGLKDA